MIMCQTWGSQDFAGKEERMTKPSSRTTDYIYGF